MYGCESWTIKKAEHWRIDAFELWCCIKLLRVPVTARRSNQSTLEDISPEYSLEGLMLKLKLYYFGHLMQRTGLLPEKTPMPGKIEGRKRRWQRVRWLDDITNAGQDWRPEKKGMREDEMVGWHHRLDRHEFEQAPGSGDGRGSLECCSPWGHKVSDNSERLNWDMNIILIFENFKNHKFFQNIKNKHWPLKIF